MDRIPVPLLLRDLSQVFASGGFSVYLVGGAVRDIFLGRKAEDWDVATNATPEQVAGLFRHIIPTGIAHGTVTIPFKGHHIECTTFRTEEGFTDGRRPDSISYSDSIEEDLSRRDFTMNAIAVSLPDGKIIDPFNGRVDIKNHLIRTVGNPAERFSEDGLRPLRAVRFSAQLAFSIDESTLAAIKPALDVTARVAKERIREELSRLLMAPMPTIGLRFMESTGLLSLVLPELAKCRGIEQKGRHRFDVLDHLYHTCDACPPENLELRLACLLHDIGKPEVRMVDNAGVYTFHGHEIVSAKISAGILDRLRYPHKIIKTVTHLVSQHMFHYESVWSDAAVRRFIVRTKVEHIDSLFTIRRADTFAISGTLDEPPELAEFRDRIQAEVAKNSAFSLKDLAINGTDLIQAGIPSGPKTGQILSELLETVLEDPELNTKERLLEIAGAIIKQRNISV